MGRLVFGDSAYVQETVLNNIPKIDNVITTGKFAWAIDFNEDSTSGYKPSAIFYDGQSWDTSGGQNIPNVESITAFYPAYPVSGAKPYAWISGLNADGKNIISYFNGQVWSQPKLVSDIFNTDLYNEVEIRATAGRAFLYAQTKDKSGKPTIIYTTMNATSASQQNWSVLHSLAGTFDSFASVAFNGTTPYLFLLVDPVGDGSEGYTLARINPDNSSTMINIEGLSTPATTRATLLADDQRIYVDYLPGDTYPAPVKIAYNANNGDGQWTYISDVDPFAEMFPNDQYKGLVCKFPYESEAQQLSLHCVDFNKPTPIWTPTVNVVPSNLQQWYTMTSTNSAWLGYFTDEHISQVLHYDVATQQLKNLNFPSIPSADSLVMRLINDQQIVVCNGNKNLIQGQLDTYDITQPQKGWQRIHQTSTNIAGCHFSSSGGLFPHTRNINIASGEAIWLYTQKGQSENSSLAKQRSKTLYHSLGSRD